MFVELQEGAGLFGNNDREEGFLLFSEKSTFGDEAETFKVHVCARCDGNAGLVSQVVFTEPFFATGYSESSGGFDDRTGVFEDVLDRRTDLF
jgi:hypothetical protein